MDTTFTRIYALARQIPFGRVATYGQLAALAGNPRLSRIVGCAMSTAGPFLPDGRVDLARCLWAGPEENKEGTL